MASTALNTKSPSLRRAIIVCALGYFIDVFDIQLFAVLRVPSLTELGISGDRLAIVGGIIQNAQMLGMVLGAFLWGWVGDRFGRIKALYGSILIYSLATLACGFVQNAEMYGGLRFITGFGLAGETGAAVTIVSELMSKQKRGWGVALTGGLGLLGPVFAITISWFVAWRTTYVIAGGLGIALLALRMRLMEPALFAKMSADDAHRGSLRLLLQPEQFKIFLRCILTGLPTLFSWFVLNFFSAEFSRAVLEPGAVFNQKLCLLLFFFGTSCGAFSSGAISQIWHSRKKTLGLYLLAGAVITVSYLLLGPRFKMPVNLFYALYYVIGVAAGGWLMLTMVASEHFGTNIRATTTILVTNLMRGCTILMILCFQMLQGAMSITNAAAVIGATLYVFAFPALMQLRETYGLDLDYVERLEKLRSK